MDSLLVPRSTLLVGIALLVMACSGWSGGSSSDDASASPSDSVPGDPSPSGSPAGDGQPPVPGDPAIVDPILADAADRAGVPPHAVALESLVAVTWSDGALGCPEPGMSYTQAEVDGWQAIVVAAGARLDYRIRGPGQFIVCEQPAG